MVDPTKVKPRFCRFSLMASDSGVRAGRCFNDLQEFTRDLPTSCHTYRLNEPYSCWIFRNALAFATADAIFSRLHTMPSFFSRVSAGSCPNSGPPVLLRGSGTRTTFCRRAAGRPILRRDSGSRDRCLPIGNGRGFHASDSFGLNNILCLQRPGSVKFQSRELCLLLSHICDRMRIAAVYPLNVTGFELSGSRRFAFNVVA